MQHPFLETFTTYLTPSPIEECEETEPLLSLSRTLGDEWMVFGGEYVQGLECISVDSHVLGGVDISHSIDCDGGSFFQSECCAL